MKAKPIPPPNPRDASSVATWIARTVSDAYAPRSAWVRWVAGGPGWWLTPDESPPSSGRGWRLAVTLTCDEAINFLQLEWLTHTRTVSKIREALVAAEDEAL